MTQNLDDNGYRATDDSLIMARVLDEGLRAATPRQLQAALTFAPEASRGEIERMVRLAHDLRALAEQVEPSPAFRATARERLAARMAASAPHSADPVERPNRTYTGPKVVAFRRATSWGARAVAGLAAVSIASFATVNASASALPGELLYGVKQAREAITLQLAADDEARAEVLLRQADARLEETTRLLDRGFPDAAEATAGRYEETVRRAVVQVARAEDEHPSESAPRLVELLESRLADHQERLRDVLAGAPESARPGLERAAEASRQGLQRAAEVHEQTPGPPTQKSREPDGRAPKAGASGEQKQVPPFGGSGSTEQPGQGGAPGGPPTEDEPSADRGTADAPGAARGRGQAAEPPVPAGKERAEPPVPSADQDPRPGTAPPVPEPGANPAAPAQSRPGGATSPGGGNPALQSTQPPVTQRRPTP